MLKKDLRVAYRKKRDELPAGSAALKSALIGEALVQWLLQEKTVKRLHTFLPATGKNEVDTFLILNQIRKDLPSLEILVPRIASQERQLTHHLFTDVGKLVANRWGIPEPEETAPLDPRSIDAVLVPMLIFDKAGHRVGYGGGFYDTFLAGCRPDTLKIGLCFFDPVNALSDAGPHDIRMNICITPGRTWVFD